MYYNCITFESQLYQMGFKMNPNLYPNCITKCAKNKLQSHIKQYLMTKITYKEGELNINDRYQELIKWNGHSAAAFAKEIGITRGALASITNRGSEPSYSTIMTTLSRFKEISTSWLIEGKGEMLKEENALKIEEENEVLKILRDQLKIKDQQILKYSENISQMLSLLNMKPKG